MRFTIILILCRITTLHSAESITTNNDECFGVDSGIDYSPGSHDLFGLDEIELSTCCSLCKRTPGCKTYVWSKSTSSCWGKSVSSPKVINPDRISGFPGKIHTNPKEHCLGVKSGLEFSPGSYDIAKLDLTDLSGCCSFCNSHAGCRAFVWSMSRGECWLKGVDFPITKNKDRISGFPSTRNSIEAGQERVKIINSNLTKEFVKGVENQYLTCTATGFPPIELKWIYNKTSYPRLITSLESSNAVQSKLKLIFPEPPLETSKFICNAKNYVNEDSATFSVTLIDANGLPYVLIIAPVVITILAAIFMLGLLYRKKMNSGGLSKEEIEAFLNGDSKKLESNKNDYGNYEYQPYNQRFELKNSQLVIDTENIVGSGNFAVVLKGKYQGKTVAVKTIKERAEVNQIRDLLRELKIMIHVGNHPFVIGLIGAQTRELNKGRICIAIEFCPFGDLQTYLRARKDYFIDLYNKPKKVYANLNDESISTTDLLLWSSQIASAMTHLVSRKVIHGDLACRNVLLLNKGVVKLTDFGLSHQLYEYSTYTKKQQVQLPWRWMAIESLTFLTFSSQSDVWSFGVTLWEIFTLAELPYPGLSWTLEFPKLLEKGTRLLKPNFAPRSLYDIMLSCWESMPEARPTFSQLYDNIVLIKNQVPPNPAIS